MSSCPSLALLAALRFLHLLWPPSDAKPQKRLSWCFCSLAIPWCYQCWPSGRLELFCGSYTSCRYQYFATVIGRPTSYRWVNFHMRRYHRRIMTTGQATSASLIMRRKSCTEIVPVTWDRTRRFINPHKNSIQFSSQWNFGKKIASTRWPTVEKLLQISASIHSCPLKSSWLLKSILWQQLVRFRRSGSSAMLRLTDHIEL